MSIVVVGSVAFDSIETPFGKADRTIGGAATYFSVAASFFSSVQLVGVVGSDFGSEEMRIFEGRPIDLTGLTRLEQGRTFYWSGAYGYDLNVANTLDTQLNVFAQFKPTLPESYRNASVVFLANIDPELQLEVLAQVDHPRIVALDTMNYWISSKRDALAEVMKKSDLILVNEGELRQFTGEANLVRGARRILDLGSKIVVVKRGEYGVLMISGEKIFAAPAFPLENVFDPTGAGDSFAGGFLGYLASCRDLDDRELRRATVYGSVVASFVVEAFGLGRILEISRDEIDSRFEEFKALTHFDSMRS